MRYLATLCLGVLISVGALCSCVGDEDECIPGATEPCYCDYNVRGTQLCEEAGSWSTCHCRGGDGDGDADTDIDGDSDSDGDVVYGDGNCPGHRDMVLIPSLNSCIDQYEASGGQVGEARSIIGTLPWKEVSWFEARVACELAGKRLCEPFEWAQACQGTEGSLYPYGSIYEPDRCYGADRSGSTGSYQDPVPTGSMTDCEGGYSGLFDMSGNLWEWTADCSGDDCQMRGGSYQDVREDLLCESTYTGDGDRAYLDTGFRCCLSL